jgi:glycerol-3-phosphate responsive antiterminator
MSVSVTNHIVQRYKERVRKYYDQSVVKTLIETFNSSETVVNYIDSNNDKKTIKATKDNLVIVAKTNKMGRVTLVTCFYAKDLERFRNLA